MSKAGLFLFLSLFIGCNKTPVPVPEPSLTLPREAEKSSVSKRHLAPEETERITNHDNAYAHFRTMEFPKGKEIGSKKQGDTLARLYKTPDGQEITKVFGPGQSLISETWVMGNREVLTRAYESGRMVAIGHSRPFASWHVFFDNKGAITRKVVSESGKTFCILYDLGAPTTVKEGDCDP